MAPDVVTITRELLGDAWDGRASVLCGHCATLSLEARREAAHAELILCLARVIRDRRPAEE